MNIRIQKAISDEVRLKMMYKIRKGEICACKIPEYFSISQPAVSRHLKILLLAGLLTMREDGKKRIYSLSPKGRMVLRDMAKW
jgi:ArsR family transcriptional regulator